MKINISSFFIWIMITLSFFSYDSILYSKYYTIITGAVMLTGLLSILFSFSSKGMHDITSLKENKLTIILLFSLVVSSLLSSLITSNISYSDIVSSITTGVSIILFMVLVPNRMNNIGKFYKYILFLISCSAILAILMQNFNVTFGHIQSEPTRMASIFFDANYFGSMCVIAIILSFFLITKTSFKLAVMFINILALYYSNSRGATLALIGSIIVYYVLVKRKNIKTLLTFSVVAVILIAVLIILEEHNFFRVYQGLNSRDFLWKIAFNLISVHPFVGYGKSSIDFLLKNAGALNGSTHNSWLDFTISYGVINLVLYFIIMVTAVIRGLKKHKKKIMLLVFFFIINSNSINISLGGVGFNSLVFTISLGLLNTNDENIFI